MIRVLPLGKQAYLDRRITEQTDIPVFSGQNTKTGRTVLQAELFYPFRKSNYLLPNHSHKLKLNTDQSKRLHNKSIH